MFVLLCLALLQADDLGAVKTIEEYDFSIRTPEGWKAIAVAAPALIKLFAPEGGASITLRHVDGKWPVPMKTFVEDLKAYLVKEVPEHKLTTDEELKVGGYPARLIVVQGRGKDGKDVVMIKSLVARSLREFYMVDGTCGAKDVDRVTALLRKVLDSMKIGLDVPKAEADAVRALPVAAAPAGLVGERWYKVLLRDRKLGWQRSVVREDKLDGAPAWAFESEQQLAYDDGRTVHRTTGAFTADGAVQRCEHELQIDDPKGKRVYRESITLRAGEASAVRDINGTKGEARFRVPDRTFLAEVADLLRGIVATKGKAACGLRVLEPFRDEPLIEIMEVGAAEAAKVNGEDRDIATVLVKFARRQQLQYLYDGKSGSLVRLTSGGSVFQVLACTRDEAQK